MNVFERLQEEQHEEVVFCADADTGMKPIIAIHSTTLGPALGGARFYPYDDEEAALEDVLLLSTGMTYKAAAAGLGLGGGKAVIIGDPERTKSADLLHAFGRAVDRLRGRYITAEDVNTEREDMDLIQEVTQWVVGCSESAGGSGDPSPVTAFGVLQGIKAALFELDSSVDLKGKTVAVQGVGKVGYALIEYLVGEGADVIAADKREHAANSVKALGARVVDYRKVHEVEADVFSPCAMGKAINDSNISSLRCRIVAGAANNQLARPQLADELSDRGILYAPDFVINAGGLINVDDERKGYVRERAMKRVEGIFDSLCNVFAIARDANTSTHEAALVLAKRRIDEATQRAVAPVLPMHGFIDASY